MLMYAVYANKQNISRHFVSERQSRAVKHIILRKLFFKNKSSFDSKSQDLGRLWCADCSSANAMLISGNIRIWRKSHL